MRILIAYDGSDYARAALNDLLRAGLPHEGEALIVSVGDVLVPPSSSIKEIAGTALASRRVTATIMQAQAQASKMLEEARKLASDASVIARSHLPGWHIRAEALVGSPSQELIRKAEGWEADLIVVGTHGRSALGRFFLGSVSKEIAAESQCSVRVARHVGQDTHTKPVRIIIGVDGSVGAAAAVSQVGRRVWAEGTEVRIIAVNDSAAPPESAGITPTTEAAVSWAQEGAPVEACRMLEWAAEELGAIGLNSRAEIHEGDPRLVLIDEAQKWMADSIFVGSRGTAFSSSQERFRMGSVSTGLVIGAPCSVEVVREKNILQL